MVARRIRQATGVPVHIGDLVYNVFNSTFNGKAIVAGPPKRPFLRLKTIKVKMELMADRPGTTVGNIEATGMRARVKVKFLGQPLIRTYKMITVRRASVGGRVEVVGKKGAQIVCEGVTFSLANLVVPVTRWGQPPRLSGTINLTARRLTIGGQTFTNLTLAGKLKGGRVLIKRANASFLGGPAVISGHIDLDSTVDLTADVTLRPWGPGGATIAGKVRFKGSYGKGYAVTGKLKTDGKVRRRRGGTRSAPPFKLRIKVGKRRLTGTLHRWRVR